MVRLEYLRNLVRQAQDRQEKAFDKGKREREYEVGEEVRRGKGHKCQALREIRRSVQNSGGIIANDIPIGLGRKESASSDGTLRTAKFACTSGPALDPREAGPD